MSQEKQDRRQHVRLPKNYSVEVSAFKFPIAAQPKVKALSADISAGGLSVDVPGRYAPGEMVQVKVTVPCLNKFMPGFFKVYENDADQHLQAIAEVAWAEPGADAGRQLIGLRFVDLAEDSFVALKKMVEKAVRDGEK